MHFSADFVPAITVRSIEFRFVEMLARFPYWLNRNVIFFVNRLREVSRRQHGGVVFVELFRFRTCGAELQGLFFFLFGELLQYDVLFSFSRVCFFFFSSSLIKRDVVGPTQSGQLFYASFLCVCGFFFARDLVSFILVFSFLF